MTPTRPPVTATHRPRPRRRRFALAAVAVLTALLAAAGGLAANRAAAADERQEAAAAEPALGIDPGRELGIVDVIVLGVVEGVTEYLPVSSTGHLVVTERLLGLGDTEATNDALDAYTVIIQFGAILAVLLLYRERVRTVALGAIGRSVDGRRLLVALMIAFVPAAVAGVAGNAFIDEHLLEPAPIAAAWIVGGIGVLVLTRAVRRRAGAGAALEDLTARAALVVGAFQVLALWPGMSRSLVTIAGGLVAGLGLGAAVEFSFLLGLVTLSAASFLSAAKDGRLVLDTFGIARPLLGLAVAAVSAALAVRWLVAYLNRRDLSIFGWYRIVIGVATLVLVATDVI